MYYVRVERFNGRRDYYRLADIFDSRGFGNNIEYNEGWEERDRKVHPHLRFLDEQDALAYVLAFGGEIKREMPFSARNDCGV